MHGTAELKQVNFPDHPSPQRKARSQITQHRGLFGHISFCHMMAAAILMRYKHKC